MSNGVRALSEPQAMDYSKLLLLSAIWGSSFICIEYALVDFKPLMIAALRICLGALTLVPIVYLLGQRLPRSARTWRLIFIIGFLYSALPFTLISWGQQFISGGTTAIALAFGPLIALIIAHFFTADDRFNLAKLLGVVIGFSGAMVLIGVEALDGSIEAVQGQLAVVLAVSCYISASILTRRLGELSSLVSSAAILFSAALYMFPLAVLIDPPRALPGLPAGLAILFLGIVPTALAYLLRIQIVQQVGSIFLSQVSYLIPLFAIFWGWLFLAEVPRTSAWIALALITTGLVVSRMKLSKTG